MNNYEIYQSTDMRYYLYEMTLKQMTVTLSLKNKL